MHYQVMKTLSINGYQITAIPYCMPSSVAFLQIHSVNLKEAAVTPDVHQQWPDSLTLLQLENNSLYSISKNFLTGLPKTLTKLLIIDQPRLRETSFIMYLPLSSLCSLTLSNVSIKDIPRSHLRELEKCNVLKSLGIRHTLLEHIPYKLPSSLLRLRLNNNKITQLDTNSLTYLTRLQYLDLSWNLIQTVPKAFPESLEELYLGHNNIRTLSTEAFTGLSTLKILFLPENR